MQVEGRWRSCKRYYGQAGVKGVEERATRQPGHIRGNSENGIAARIQDSTEGAGQLGVLPKRESLWNPQPSFQAVDEVQNDGEDRQSAAKASQSELYMDGMSGSLKFSHQQPGSIKSNMVQKVRDSVSSTFETFASGIEPQPQQETNSEDAPNPQDWLKAIDEVQENEDWGSSADEAPLVEFAPRTVHIMGVNKFGNFIAQSLRNSGTPVTLLMDRPLHMQDWHDEGQSIRLLRGAEMQTITGFSIESTATDQDHDNPDRPVYRRFGEHLEHTSEPPDSVIDILFITSSPGIILSSLSRVVHRLRPESTICFCQNGLGIAEKVNRAVFPDPKERPNYMLASLSHVLEAGRNRHDVAEAKSGQLTCTKLPRDGGKTFEDTNLTISRPDFSWPLTAKSLAASLLQATDMNTQMLGHKSFYRKQLLNLAMHALIDSISVAFELKCEELLFNYKISQYMGIVLTEISLIIQELPELRNMPNVKQDFSVAKLQARAYTILKSIGDKETEYLAETKQGRIRSGMEFYSGFLLNKAKKHRIQAPVLGALMLQVEAKQQYYSRVARNFIPLEHRNRPGITDDDDGKV